MPSISPPPAVFYRDFIAGRLPDWLATANADDLRRLNELTERAEHSRRALQAAAQRLPQYEHYASQALEGLLDDLGVADVAPGTAVMHWVDPNDDSSPLTCTLVQAALRNFTEADIAADAFGAGSGLFHSLGPDGQPVAQSRIALAPWDFAKACRQADIGAAFARLLAEQLPISIPAASEGPLGNFPRLFCQADRDSLAAEACMASLKGCIDEIGQAMLANWGLAPRPVSAPLPATARGLQLSGFGLDRVLVILANATQAEGRPCLLYVPNDPHAPLKQFPSPDALVDELRTRLAHPAYVRFFAGYVALEQEPAFIRALEGPPLEDFDRLFGTSINPLKALEAAVRVIEGKAPFERPRATVRYLHIEDLFSERYAGWARHSLANASVLAVPTGRIDRLAALARHERWVAAAEQMGIFVLSFVPGVGQAIAVYSMVQTLHSVFEASLAWLQGDERLARSLLIGSAENARFLVPPQPAVGQARETDLLQRVELIAQAGGQTRLWVPDLETLGSTQMPAGAGPLPADGIVRSNGRAWVHLGGRFVEVDPDATPYQATLRSDASAGLYRSRLLGNGQGGWWGEHERPGRWSGPALVRRINTDAAALDDAEVQLAQQLAGIDDTALQARAVRGERGPGLLRYLLRRRASRRALGRAIASLREGSHLPSAHPAIVSTLVELPAWPSEVGIDLHGANGGLIQLQSQRPRSLGLSAEELVNGDWVPALLQQLTTEELAPLAGDSTSVPAAARELQNRWAQVLERQRSDVAQRMAEGPEPDASDAVQRATLARQFPSLPGVLLDELLAGCDSTQRSQLERGRVPLPIAELAVASQRQLRISLACEALHDGHPTADRDNLLVGLLADLGAWPQDMAIELRQSEPSGALLVRSGPAQREALVIVAYDGRYQPWSKAGRPLAAGGTLEQALIELLREYRAGGDAALPDAQTLNERLAQRALARRESLHHLLKMTANTQLLFRPPTRLADGRLGYVLSGRGAGGYGARDIINLWLRQLYPEADNATLQALRDEVGEGAGAFQEIARRQLQLSELRMQLGLWIGEGHQPSAVPGRSVRELIARLIIQAWQRRSVSVRADASDGAVRHLLSLAYIQTGNNLPALTVAMPHILELDLTDMGLERIDPAFLALFPNARILHINENPLLELPRGPEWLGRLREVSMRNIGPYARGNVMDWLQAAASTLQRLQLSDNPQIPVDRLLSIREQFAALRHLELNNSGIELSEQTQGAFVALGQLEHLSLDGNRLGLPPVLGGLNRLRWLSMADTGVDALPPGLAQLMDQADRRLRYVNLAGNAIRRLPELSATAFFRRAEGAWSDPAEVDLILDGNPLDADSVTMLNRAGFDFDPRIELEGMSPEALGDVWLLWCPEPLRTLIREARNDPEAAAFYQVLSEVVRTAAYRRAQSVEAQQEVARRAWTLAGRFVQPGEGALPGLTELRDRLYEMAIEAQATCGDGVALTLDQFEAEISVWEAMASSTLSDANGPLVAALEPARGLYRQALLDAQAQRLIRARQARLEQREAADPATDLEDDLPPSQLDIGVDEVELRLLLRQRLRETLGLSEVSERLYASVVTDTTVNRVAERVMALDTRQGFAQWLVDHQQTWHAALDRRYAEQLEQAREPYNDALAYVLALAEGGGRTEPLSSAALAVLQAAEPQVPWQDEAGASNHPALSEQQAYVLSNRLSVQCTQAVDALRLQLTLALID